MRVRVLATVLLIMVSCADPPLPGDGGPANVSGAVPDVAEIVCEADGSTTVATPEVMVQPDGIHVHVVSHLDEPAEIVGLFGRDVEAGVTDYVSLVPPGRIDTGCFPYSEHEAPDSLETSALTVLDPEGTYVSDEIECTGTASSMIADFLEAPLDAGPVPLDVARAEIRGLEDGDEVVRTGYPEQARAGVAVVRDGTVVATFGFVTFDAEKWSIETADICSSSGITHRGA